MIMVCNEKWTVWFDGQTVFRNVVTSSSQTEFNFRGEEVVRTYQEEDIGDPITNPSPEMLEKCRESWQAYLQRQVRDAYTRHQSELVRIGGESACRWQWRHGEGPALRTAPSAEDMEIIKAEGLTASEDRGYWYVSDPDLDCPE